MFSHTLVTRGAPVDLSIPRVATGWSELDALLDGGLPCGHILEISGPASSGKSTLAFGACLSLLQQGKVVAWVDTQGFWPLAGLEAQCALEKLLVLRVRDGMTALRACFILLSCRGAASAVVLTLPAGFAPAETNLLKLQRLAEQAHTALVFVTERKPQAPSLGACVALRLCVHRSRRGQAAPVTVVEVARHKKGPNWGRVEARFRGPDRLRVRSTL